MFQNSGEETKKVVSFYLTLPLFGKMVDKPWYGEMVNNDTMIWTTFIWVQTFQTESKWCYEGAHQGRKCSL